MPFLARLTHGLLSPRILSNQDANELPSPNAADALRVCGAVGCTNGWLKPWKNRHRPVFEDAWGCSGRCLEKLVAASVRREMGGGDFALDAQHQHRIPLGLVLLAQGWITHPQLQTALAAQKAAGAGRIGDWLVEHCGLPEERVARGLGVQWNRPVLSLENFSPRAMALMMPKRFVSEFGMIPIRVAGSSILYVAFQQKMNVSAAFGLEQMIGLKVECGLLPSTLLLSAQSRILAADTVPAEMYVANDTEALSVTIAKTLELKQPIASRLVRIQDYFWMRLWKEEGALISQSSAPQSPEDIEDYIYKIEP